MYKRRAARNRLFDRLHKGFVLGCMGLTLYGTFLLGERLYTYFTLQRPALKLKQAEEKQKLLSEGKATDPTVLLDSSVDLKA